MNGIVYKKYLKSIYLVAADYMFPVNTFAFVQECLFLCSVFSFSIVCVLYCSYEVVKFNHLFIPLYKQGVEILGGINKTGRQIRVGLCVPWIVIRNMMEGRQKRNTRKIESKILWVWNHHLKCRLVSCYLSANIQYLLIFS